jgi:hypothetical protein
MADQLLVNPMVCRLPEVTPCKLTSMQLNSSLMQVEVKCFSDEDAETTDLYAGLGQYLVYRSLLNEADLYLNVPVTAYESVFRPAVSENRIKMIVVDLDKEVFAEWLG